MLRPMAQNRQVYQNSRILRGCVVNLISSVKKHILTKRSNFLTRNRPNSYFALAVYRGAKFSICMSVYLFVSPVARGSATALRNALC